MRLHFRPASVIGIFLFHNLVYSAAKGSATFKWPDPQLDFIDEMLYSANIFVSLTLNCAARQNTTIAAQWVRVAYHDMATHDVTDGSGGLDGSIAFELDRPQNVGQGMPKSLTDFSSFTSPYVGLADLTAMGTVLAVASCGGPIIPYRGGRIDAKVAGPATVPEPQQDLQSHIDSFRRQGFTQTEMIALVACGHTLGGVSRDDFPTIVDASAPNLISTFDKSLFKFDNAVVTEYLDDTTANPLIKSTNVTTQSDLRIFSSDQNATMKSIASPENFSQTCGSLLERMINTVPTGVGLTEAVDPIENKVRGVSLVPQNGNYVLRANFRRLSANPSRTITLFWKERQNSGSICPAAGCAVKFTSLASTPTTFFGGLLGIQSLSTYQFTTPIPLNTSISKFWFSIDENDGSGPKLLDNGGFGYVIDQDTVLFDPSRTAIITTIFRLVVGVRTSEIAADFKLSVESYQPGTTTFIPTVQTFDLLQDTKYLPADGYTFFTGNVSTRVTAIHVNAVIGGKTFSQYVDVGNFRV